MKLAKILAVILAVAVVANFLGLAFGVIKPLTFWIVTIVAAVTAYKIIPNLAKKK